MKFSFHFLNDIINLYKYYISLEKESYRKGYPVICKKKKEKKMLISLSSHT